MIIYVQEHNLLAGQRFHNNYCPIALAIQEALPEVSNVSVTPEYVRLNGSAERISLPNLAQEFIYRFDLGMTVRPFEFELEV